MHSSLRSISPGLPLLCGRSVCLPDLLLKSDFLNGEVHSSKANNGVAVLKRLEL